jgi:hypothetical protein
MINPPLEPGKAAQLLRIVAFEYENLGTAPRLTPTRLELARDYAADLRMISRYFEELQHFNRIGA